MKKKIVAMITACAMIASMVSVMPAYADETEASLAAVIGEVPSEKEEDAIALRERIMAQYGENKPITDGNYDAALAVKCVNGTFVGKKTDDNVIAYKGIPYVGAQPVGEYRWKAPVDVEPDDGVYEAYYFGKVPCQVSNEIGRAHV